MGPDTNKTECAATASGGNPQAGMTRLPVVVATALVAFYQEGLLAYALPLYFAACGMPSSAWETWGLYQILGALVGPLLNWLLARCLGVRRVWALALSIIAVVLAWLVLLPAMKSGGPAVVGVLAMLYGLASLLGWTSGITLTQNVPPAQRGRANSQLMIALGLGSVVGPLVGRLGLALLQSDDRAALPGFVTLFASAAVLNLLGAVLVHYWGEHGPAAAPQARGSGRPTLRDDLRLIRSWPYLLLVIPLSLLAGPTFQAMNVYLPYRVAEPAIGLIRQGQDHGWVALRVTSYAMQLLGGLLLSLIAGKKASRTIATALFAAFVLCGIGTGLAPGATTIFASVAIFEIMRQFMRWLQTGYVTEFVSSEQRPAAISVSVLLSGLSSTGFLLLLRRLQSPDAPSFSSTLPFLLAGAIGLAGVLLLACRRTGPTAPADSAIPAPPGA
jgi:MFS family permease